MASSNKARTFCSDSLDKHNCCVMELCTILLLVQKKYYPDIPDTISGAEMRKKGSPSSPGNTCVVGVSNLFFEPAYCKPVVGVFWYFYVPATALASRVLPHPGGPWSRIPRGGSTPSSAYISGWLSGYSINWRTSWSTDSIPPMSE